MSPTIIRLFQEHVARRPSSLAVEHGDRKYSYEDLDRKSNQLARCLERYGVGPEVVVGIVTGRSIDTVLAIFAVLKCGAAYLPIDLKYPEQRLNYMLRDAGCGVVLAKDPRLLPVREGVHWLTLDDLLSQPVSDAPVDRIVSETSSAYVI